VAFIDAHRDDVVEGRPLGVEPICRVLQVAPSTYYAAKTRPPSARAGRDAELVGRLVALWEDNYRVYGARKLWKAARRAGLDVGRDQVARLMRVAGIEGARRTRRVRTTRAAPAAARHPDLVQRWFEAAAPNQLWVTDLTFVPTWAGIAYVCFIVDAFSRMIVGWRVAPHMRTSMVLDALEMARWSRGTDLAGLRCHSDAGSQFTSVRYGERLAELGAVPSIGSVGDSFDNALAETVNGYYKAELIRGPTRQRPWKTVEDVELATLGWVHWHNTQRLHSYLDDRPPAEYEQTFYPAQGADHSTVEIP
jgi:putative transposase